MRCGLSILLLLLTSACAASRPVAGAPAPRRLSPDSLALLKEAIAHVRPAYATQEEALRSGLYGRPDVPAMAVQPLPAPERRAGAYVIQIGAFRDPAVANAAAVTAGRRFPSLEVLIEVAGGIHRVALAGVDLDYDAAATLAAARRYYPDAWLRDPAVP